jgi:FkbM family methyltransferase
MANYFRFGLLEWARRNKIITSIWRGILPNSIRLRIVEPFSELSKELQEMRKVLLNLLEDETIDFSKFEKKDEVLKILKKNKYALSSPDFMKIWLQKDASGNLVFNFNGAIIPYMYKEEIMFAFRPIFLEIFLFSIFFNDNYSRPLVERLEKDMFYGPYGYTDGDFDVTVQKDDIVIDAGAWIGDFSAYAAAKGAAVYAFEPTVSIFPELERTAEFNSKDIKWGGGGIIPINKGLGDFDGKMEFFVEKGTSGMGNTVIKDSAVFTNIERINITTLDKFVHEQNLRGIDFIKSDIEGAERDMLKGAYNVLKEFAPKLALCTYHLPDDPDVMEQLIKDANPKYRVVQIRNKLFACI